LIEPSEAKGKTTSGLFIPDTAKEKPVEEGKVFTPTVLKPGDQVLYEKYGTTEVDLDGKELVLVRESDVLGLVG
jgi:chaperonin GroES